MMLENRTIYCKDNLGVLKRVSSNSVDMIYLDPPFNKGRTFTAFVGSEADGASFDDTFSSDTFTEQDKEQIKSINEDLYRLIDMLSYTANKSDVAYIGYMAIRIVECHRVLKDTGALFYHCDDTMQHYIKIMLDIVFGRDSFKNEINWKRYSGNKATSKKLGRITDAILYYSKTDKHTFNKIYNKRDNEDKYYNMTEKETGRKFNTSPII